MIEVPKILCPECGPHGNLGKIALLYSWVDCLTCHPPVAAGFYEPLCGCEYPLVFMVQRVNSCPRQPYPRPKPQEWHAYSKTYACAHCKQDEPLNPELTPLCMRCAAEAEVCTLCGSLGSQSPCVACLALDPKNHTGELVMPCTLSRALRWKQGDRSFYTPKVFKPALNWHEIVTEEKLLANLWEGPT
jgi:hypothetical protein